jgi:hypothetical protein
VTERQVADDVALMREALPWLIAFYQGQSHSAVGHSDDLRILLGKMSRAVLNDGSIAPEHGR